MTTTLSITKQEALNFIKGTSGRIFSLEFIKRTTGELRCMVCRTGVTVNQTGNGPTYSREDKGLTCVFDMPKQAYRMIPTEGITRIKIDGEWKEVS